MIKMPVNMNMNQTSCPSSTTKQEEKKEADKDHEVSERILHLYLTKKLDLSCSDASMPIPYQTGKESFDSYILKILKPSGGTTLESLMFELDPTSPPIKWLEFITNLTNVLRNEIVLQHLIASKEIQFRYRAIGFCLHHQSKQLKELVSQKSQLQQAVSTIDTKCKNVLEKYGDIKTRLNDLLIKLADNTTLSDAEHEMNLELINADGKIKELKEKMGKLTKKSNYYFIRMKNLRRQYHKKSLFLKDEHKTLIISKLQNMTSDIANLVERVKMTKLRTRSLCL